MNPNQSSFRSAEELLRRVMTQPELIEKIKTDPAKEIQGLVSQVTKEIPAMPPLEYDVWIYRMVVTALGVVIVLSVAGAIYLTAIKVEIPDILTAIGSAAVGALAGLLSPSPSQK